jgi:hypothetical protein
MALGAAAQTPSTTATASTTDQARDQVTVSGCLQDNSHNSTAATSSTSTTGGDYTLVNATMGKAESTSTTATSSTTAGATTGTTGTTGSTASDTTSRGQVSYALEGSGSELKSHVGHRIEVTGTLEDNHAPTASSTATSTTTSGAASSRMNSAPERLKVSSVKMIAPDCSSR